MLRPLLLAVQRALRLAMQRAVLVTRPAMERALLLLASLAMNRALLLALQRAKHRTKSCDPPKHKCTTYSSLATHLELQETMTCLVKLKNNMLYQQVLSRDNQLVEQTTELIFGHPLYGATLAIILGAYGVHRCCKRHKDMRHPETHGKLRKPCLVPKIRYRHSSQDDDTLFP